MVFREQYNAIVTNVNDPEQRGRIKFKSQELFAEDVEYPDWISPSFQFTGGGDAGMFFLPDVGDPIRIEAVTDASDDDVPGMSWFMHPDIRWIGCTYSDADDVPEEFRGDFYTKRCGFKTKAGQLIWFDKDSDQITIKSAGGTVEVGDEIRITTAGGSVVLSGTTVTVTATTIVLAASSVLLGGLAAALKILVAGLTSPCPINPLLGHIGGCTVAKVTS
jgi:hypothetical protein